MFDLGFRHFVGVDGSERMLEKAAQTNLYQDLKLAILGPQLLPTQPGMEITVTSNHFFLASRGSAAMLVFSFILVYVSKISTRLSFY